MTRHYSTRDFFRQMPNALLARYFSAREVLQEFDCHWKPPFDATTA